MRLPNYPPPLASRLTRPFYEGLREGRLDLPTCPECSTRYWYPTEVLPCHPEAEAEWRPASSEGIVYSYTVIERSLLPKADPASVPYTIVMVEPVDAPGARIIGLLVDEDGAIECGDRVRFRPLPIADHVVPGFARIQDDPQN